MGPVSINSHARPKHTKGDQVIDRSIVKTRLLIVLITIHISYLPTTKRISGSANMPPLSANRIRKEALPHWNRY